jgi:hypothetical protein
MDDHEDRVRTLAYRLWEEAGRPHGRGDEFWHAAERQIASRPAPDQPPATSASPAAASLAPATRKPAAPAAKPAAPKRAPHRTVAPRKPPPKR